jgi:hypothetical protein
VPSLAKFTSPLNLAREGNTYGAGGPRTSGRNTYKRSTHKKSKNRKQKSKTENKNLNANRKCYILPNIPFCSGLYCALHCTASGAKRDATTISTLRVSKQMSKNISVALQNSF